MNEIEVFSIICGIVQLIAVIVFFVMASNVYKIRTILERKISPNDLIKDAKLERYLGNNLKAKEYLLRAKYIREIELSEIGDYYVNDEKKSRIQGEIDKIDVMLKEIPQ
jgi:hypothetical protein